MVQKNQFPLLLIPVFFFWSVVSLITGGFSQENASKKEAFLELVRPIITEAEREVYKRLQTDKEREKFIVFFWKQRDPRPDTEENEFYQEYMERIKQADLLFRGELKIGSQTERGYYYLLLGPPVERHLFTSHSSLWPLELWFYRGEEQYGLPPYFYLIFYQSHGQGEYRLFYPGVEGPEKLVIPSFYGRTSNQEIAYNLLRKISPELANASLSMIPGEKLPTATPLSSQNIISSIRSLPEKKFNDAYARNYLNYQGRVEVDYADRFIESSFRVRIFRHQGQTFLHWACEPKEMSFSLTQEDTMLAVYELSLRIEEGEERRGHAIWEETKEIPVKLNREEYESQKGRLFSFQDLIPVIPGKFQLHFLLKNKTVKEFTSWTTSFGVPSPSKEIYLGKPLIYYQKEKRPLNQRGKLQAFAFGDWLYLLNARSEIPAGEKIGFLCQVFLPQDQKLPAHGWLRIDFYQAAGGEAVKREEIPLSTTILMDDLLDTGLISLASLKPGYYDAQVFLLDEKKQVLAESKEEFVLLSQHYPPIPRVMARLHPGFPDSENLKILSSQYFLAGRFAEALQIAQQILGIADDGETKLLMAKALFGLKKYENSLALLLPIYKSHPSSEAAKVIALNYIGLEKWAEALPYLEKLLEEATELSVLNLAGECYLKLNLPEKALPLLEKSLKLDPNQPQVKKLEEMARKKMEKDKKAHSVDCISGLISFPGWISSGY